MKTRIAYGLALSIVLYFAGMSEMKAQLPEGLSAGENRTDRQTAAASDTTGLTFEIGTADIDSLSDEFLDSLNLSRDIPIND